MLCTRLPVSPQLNVIFDVIGTPCWKDIESVPGDAWRDYLKKLPGRVRALGLVLLPSSGAVMMDPMLQGIRTS